MARAPLHVPLRWCLAAVGSLAVLLAVVRQIELSANQNMVRSYANLAAWARENAPTPEAARYERQRAWHEAQMRGLPRSLSPMSVVAIVIYLWLAALVVVRVRESATDDTFRPSPRPFLLWLGLGMIAPACLLALGMIYHAAMPKSVMEARAVGSWPSLTVGLLFLAQLAHAMLGVVVLRGQRPRVVVLGCFSIGLSFQLLFYALRPFID